MRPIRRCSRSSRCPSAARAGPLMEWRGFHTELQRAAVAATQTGAPLSLLMLELVSSDRISEPRGVRDRSGADRPAHRIGQSRDRGAWLPRALRRGAPRGHPDRYRPRWRDRAGRAHRPPPACPAARRGPAELSPAIGIAQFRDDESLGHLIQRTAAALGRARSGRGVVADRGTERPACPGCGTIAHRLCLPLMPSTRDVGGEEPGA